MLLDIVYGFDVLALFNRVALSLFIGCMIAIPCETFSVARRGSFESGLPRALRTVEQPWGIDRSQLRDYEIVKLENANRIVRFVLAFLKKCIQHRFPLIFENPASSLFAAPSSVCGFDGFYWCLFGCF